MRSRSIAKSALCIGTAALAAVLALKQPLIEKVYAEKQQSVQVKLSPKERKQLFKEFENAVKAGDVEKAEELMNHPSGVIDEKRKTAALMIAARKGHLDIVRMLVEAGADVNAFDMDSYKTRQAGWTPLVYAAVNDRLDIVKYFIEELGIDVDQRDAVGCTPLMATSYFRKKNLDKNMATIGYLISKGADVNATASNGTTAFIGTAIDGRVDVAAILVQNGAKPDARTTDYGDTAIYRAVERDRHDFLEFLLSVGVDIDVQNDFGVSPLMKAAGNGSINSVKMLVAKGADVNLRDDAGWNALIWAVRAVDAKVDAEPKENESEIEKKMRELKQKYREESMGIINVLLSSPHMQINAKDNLGKTALDHASDEGARMLLEKHGAKQ